MDDKIIKDAQYRKGLSIAFFNATNAAIDLVASRQIADKDEALKLVVEYRDFFLKEYSEYYTKVIANVGQTYNLVDALAKLEAVQNKTQLAEVWRSFSADERHDGDIQKKAKEIKAKYEKI